MRHIGNIITLLSLIIIIIVILMLFSLCVYKLCNPNRSSQYIIDSNNARRIRSIERRRYILENELRVTEQYIDITTTLKKYLNDLHNLENNTDEGIEDENVVIIVGPNGNNIQLGVKISN